MDLITEPVNLQSFIQELTNTSKVLLKGKDVELVVDVPEGTPKVQADPLRLRQVVSNLLTNAIKFTQEGSITIRVRPCDGTTDMLAVAVIDTGLGLKKEHLPLIFERFRQVDQSATRRVGGTGLGLAITRQLVQMHNGDIWAESEVGVGSSFIFTIPAVTEA
ncbi:MAG: hypothetical protein EHM39_03425 [Chloroflexi bacterium]|nr:MAG: hypothetical protein EHM39_03425 [Chloroflexota bacterium]